jgi:hypothetical protein
LKLSGFGDFPSFNATGADFHSLRTALRKLHTNRLQVWIKPPGRAVIRVGYIITELGTFAADFATFRHDLIIPPELVNCRGLNRTE